MADGTQNYNSNLESIRSLAPVLAQNTRNYTQTLVNIIPRFKDVHTAHLFFGNGRILLQKICLFLSGTTPSYHNVGWQGLADKLELSPQHINVILNNTFYNQSPTYTTIFVYSQKSDATIDKLIQAIFDIGRYDILNEIKKHIDQIELKNKGVISTKLNRHNISNVPIEFENLQLQETTKRSPRKYDKIVMLTFTSECIQMAIQAAKILREEYNGKRIGVFMAHEQEFQLNKKADGVLRGFFQQSDYVLPILTLDYFNIIDSRSTEMSSSNSLDTKYCTFIYSMMMKRFLNKNTINDKVRCIIFDDMSKKIFRHPCMDNPLFSVWYYYSEIENLAQKILDGNL